VQRNDHSPGGCWLLGGGGGCSIICRLAINCCLVQEAGPSLLPTCSAAAGRFLPVLRPLRPAGVVVGRVGVWVACRQVQETGSLGVVCLRHCFMHTSMQTWVTGAAGAIQELAAPLSPAARPHTASGTARAHLLLAAGDPARHPVHRGLHAALLGDSRVGLRGGRQGGAGRSCRPLLLLPSLLLPLPLLLLLFLLLRLLPSTHDGLCQDAQLERRPGLHDCASSARSRTWRGQHEAPHSTAARHCRAPPNAGALQRPGQATPARAAHRS
jgi:hypothetical protein